MGSGVVSSLASSGAPSPPAKKTVAVVVLQRTAACLALKALIVVLQHQLDPNLQAPSHGRSSTPSQKGGERVVQATELRQQPMAAAAVV